MKTKHNIAPGFESQKIHIKKSPTADTRTCDPKTVTKEQLLESSKLHQKDVEKALAWMNGRLELRTQFFFLATGGLSYPHDHDKIDDIDGFHRDFQAANERPFVDGEWYQKHLRENRHHLNVAEGVPDNVDLFDVQEMIADCAVSGMARSGEVYPLELSNELLQRAVQNTLKKLVASIVVEED